MHLAYNAGRIVSYAFAGAAAGAAGSLGLMLDAWLPVQVILYALANILLVALGLYLAGLRSPITRLEHLGMGLWRRIQPSVARRPSAAPHPYLLRARRQSPRVVCPP